MSSSNILAGSPGGAGSPSYYSMGLRTYRVPLTLYATNRAKLLTALRSHHGLGPGGACANVVVYLEGGNSETRHATDHEPLFRQESYFHYLFGVREPDVRGCVELDTGRATSMGSMTLDMWRMWRHICSRSSGGEPPGQRILELVMMPKTRRRTE